MSNRKEETLARIAGLQKIKPLIEQAYARFIEEAADSMTLERLTEWRGCFNLVVPEQLSALTDGFEIQHYVNLVASCKGIIICETSGQLFTRDEVGEFRLNLEVDYRTAGLSVVPHDLALQFVKQYEATLTYMVSTGYTDATFNIVHMAFRDNQPIAKIIADELSGAVRLDGWDCTTELVKRGDSYSLSVRIS